MASSFSGVYTPADPTRLQGASATIAAPSPTDPEAYQTTPGGMFAAPAGALASVDAVNQFLAQARAEYDRLSQPDEDDGRLSGERERARSFYNNLFDPTAGGNDQGNLPGVLGEGNLSGYAQNLSNIAQLEAGVAGGGDWTPKVPASERLPFNDFVQLADQLGLIEWRNVNGRLMPMQGGTDNTVADMYLSQYFNRPHRRTSVFDKYINPLTVTSGSEGVAADIDKRNPISRGLADLIGTDSMALEDVWEKHGRAITIAMLAYMTGGAAAGLAASAGGGAAGAGTGATVGGTAGATAGATTGAAAGTAANVLAQPIVQGAIQGAAQGAVSALANGQNILEGALKGAISGGAGAGAVGAAGMDSRYMNAAINGATKAATQAALNGGDIWEAAAQGAVAGLGGAATGGGAPAAQAPVTAQAEVPPELLVGRYSPMPGTETPGMMSLANPEMLPPSPVPSMFEAPQPVVAAPQIPQMPYDQYVEALRAANLIPALQEPTVPGAPSETQEESTIDQIGRYASYAAKAYDVYQKLNPDAPRIEEFAPPERGDFSDEEYNSMLGQSAIDYLGLDPKSFEAQGLMPGTQEYLDYILAQADAIVAAAFGGDPTALLEGETVEGLQAAMRGKTADEMQALIRALNVKGVLGATGFGGEAVDPFTGQVQGLGPIAGAVTDPSRSAAMRGYAGMFGEMAGMTGPEARMAFRDFLKRDVDLFDLRKAADERRLAGMLQAAQGQMSDEDVRRKQWLQYLQMNGIGDVPMFFDERL